MRDKIKKWLENWDLNKPVWSIEMGGLGPTYEQCIQIAMAEMLRFLFMKNIDVNRWDDTAEWKKDEISIEQYLTGVKIYKELTGAQYDAALSLTFIFL